MACKIFGTLRFFKPPTSYVGEYSRRIVVQSIDFQFQKDFKSNISGLYIWKSINSPSRPASRNWQELTYAEVQEYFGTKDLFVRRKDGV